MPDEPAPESPSTPFHDLAAFVALPRCAGLALSPDGTRLVTGVATPDAEGTRYRTALWEVDPTGVAAARRLTRGDPGERDAVFTARSSDRPSHRASGSRSPIRCRTSSRP